MPYLDPTDADRFNKLYNEKSKTRISILDFKDKSDRTLTMSLAAPGIILHVYIENEMLHAYRYVVNRHTGETGSVSLNFGINLSVEDLVAEVFSSPAATDLEFAEVMLRTGFPMLFGDYTPMIKRDEHFIGRRPSAKQLSSL